MLIDSGSEEAFTESKRSPVIVVVGAVLALVITTAVFLGYTYLRNRHAQDTAAKLASQAVSEEPKGPPQALITIDDALLQRNKSVVAGTVRNISPQRIGPISVELELRHRKDATIEKKVITLDPAEIEPQQEARYSIELKIQDYASARVTGLRSGSTSSLLVYSTAQGRKRPLERPESKTITVGKSPSKGGEFLNSPDNPARIP